MSSPRRYGTGLLPDFTTVGKVVKIAMGYVGNQKPREQDFYTPREFPSCVLLASWREEGEADEDPEMMQGEGGGKEGETHTIVWHVPCVACGCEVVYIREVAG